MKEEIFFLMRFEIYIYIISDTWSNFIEIEATLRFFMNRKRFFVESFDHSRVGV